MAEKEVGFYPVLERAIYFFFNFLLSLNLASLNFFLIQSLQKSAGIFLEGNTLIPQIILSLALFFTSFIFFFLKYEQKFSKSRIALCVPMGFLLGLFFLLLSFVYFSFFGNGILPYLFTFRTELIGAVFLLLLMGVVFVKVNLGLKNKPPFWAFLLVVSFLSTVLVFFLLFHLSYREGPELYVIFSSVYIELLFLAFLYSWITSFFTQKVKLVKD